MPRKKEFEPEEALEKAMRYFWLNGYRNTSIRNLISGTSVNFYGLYNVFGDKRGIYLQGLDKYMMRYAGQIKASASKASSLSEALKQIFNTVYKIVTTENQDAGCMICNAAVEVASIDKDVALRVQNHRESLQRFCQELITKYQHELDGISEDEIKSRAEFIASQIYCMGFLVRSQCSKALIKRHMDTSIALLS